jgi:gluconate 2-dehydrogenase gamma chain
MSDFHSRRTFLRAAAAVGAAWAAADIGQVEAALAWATDQAGAGAPRAFVNLTPGEAAALEAATSRILPSDDGSPGAREAGVIFFIDRSLGTFAKGQKTRYRAGVVDLNRRAAATFKAASFAALGAAQQDQLLTAIEKTPFFQSLRVDTIVGTFALPTWGGNRDHLGWKLIGLDHQPTFQSPFGYYDAEANRKP